MSKKRAIWLSVRFKKEQVVYDIREFYGYAAFRIGGKGLDYYFSLDDELIRIFNTYKLTPAKREDDRLIFTYRDLDNGCKQYHAFAHDLAYGVYSGEVKCDSFYKDMRSYFKKKGTLTVDHADGNVHNNTSHNLSLMTRKNNMRKGNITRKVKLPDKIIIAYDGKGYYAEFTWAVDKAEQLNSMLPKGVYTGKLPLCRMCLYVKTADDLVERLDFITKAEMSWRSALRMKNGRWLSKVKKRESIVNNTRISIEEQRRVLSLNTCKITYWDKHTEQ